VIKYQNILKQNIKLFYVFDDCKGYNIPVCDILMIWCMDWDLNNEVSSGWGHNTPIHTPKQVARISNKKLSISFSNGCDFVLAVNTDNNVIFSFGRK